MGVRLNWSRGSQRPRVENSIFAGGMSPDGSRSVAAQAVRCPAPFLHRDLGSGWITPVRPHTGSSGIEEVQVVADRRRTTLALDQGRPERRG